MEAETSVLPFKGTSTGCRNGSTDFIIIILIGSFMRRGIFLQKKNIEKVKECFYNIPFKYTVAWDTGQIESNASF